MLTYMVESISQHINNLEQNYLL